MLHGRLVLIFVIILLWSPALVCVIPLPHGAPSTTPIVASAFNGGGDLFAYATSYDWSKVRKHNLWIFVALLGESVEGVDGGWGWRHLDFASS